MIRTIKKRTEALKKMEAERKGWVDRVLVPLSDIIALTLGEKEDKEKPLPYEIYGPFGLSCQTTVYFFPTDGHEICDDETYSLTVYPGGNLETSIWLEYDTGETTEQYEAGSIGWLNGFNRVKAKLPDKLGEIMELLRHHPERRSAE